MQTFDPLEKAKITENFVVFIDKSLKYLDKWFNFEDNNWLQQVQKFNLKQEISFDACESVVDVLNLKLKLAIDMDELYSDILIVNEILQKLKDCPEFQNFSTGQKWQHIFKKSENNLKNIYKLIAFLLSIPATSAFTERIFSIMNIKWREERNRAKLELIKNELFIFINLNIECEKAFNTFILDKKLLKDAKSAKKYNFYKNKNN